MGTTEWTIGPLKFTYRPKGHPTEWGGTTRLPYISMYLGDAVMHLRWQELPAWATEADGREAAAQMAIEQFHVWIHDWTKFKGLEK